MPVSPKTDRSTTHGARTGASIRQAARRGLAGSGWAVEVTAGGQDGLAAATAQRPDVILLDLIMPDLNGAEVLRRRRDSPQGADLPVLLLTSSSDAERYADLVQGIIPKPFTPDALDSRIRATLDWPASDPA